MGQGLFSDGVLNRVILSSPVWDDFRAPLFAAKIDTTSGHLDYNTAELGVDVDDSSRYDDEDMIAFIFQMSHGIVLPSPLRPHIHWFQNQSAVPNLMIRYRAYDNFGTIPAWTNVAAQAPIGTYPGSGTFPQISEFPEITTPGFTGVSGFLDVKIYRDTANTSGLFAGVDPYSGNFTGKNFDLHVQRDRLGSGTEFAL